MIQDRRLYGIWYNMKYRCNNPKSKSARWYHDKGVRVCDEWSDSFETFQSWALSNGYAGNLTIDRIDPDGNYCPENCRWLTRSENAKYSNQRTKTRIPATAGPYEVWCGKSWIVYVVGINLNFHAAHNLVREINSDPTAFDLPFAYAAVFVRKPRRPHKKGEYLTGPRIYQDE